ncbi:MAG TPA: MATE family efflux transporter [Candidatus Binatia bacterium]|nr:MATE family efflux transporter [Candidatus Binatia bacterium]
MRHLHRGDAVSAPAAPASRLELLKITWALAWPAIISFSLESVAGLCDLLMVGHLGPSAVAAVGVGVQVLSAVDTTMFAFGTGALAVVARSIGASDRGAAEEALRQSILAAVAVAAIVILPVIAFPHALVGLFSVEPAVAEAAAGFLRIVMLAVPGTAVVFVIASSLRGAGDTRTPLLIGAVVSLLNVAVGYVLIFGRLGLPVLGVRGAAMATAAAFTVGACLGLFLLAQGHLVLTVRWRGFVFRRDIVRRVVLVGYPAALESLLIQVGFFVYIVFVAHFGTGPVAAYFIGARVLALSFLPGLGFATAAGALVGQNLGADRPADARESGWAAMRLAIGMMTVAGAAIFVAAGPIARLFVSDPAVASEAESFIRILAIAQPMMAVDFVMGGALRGAGDTRFPLATVLVAFYGCRLGLAWIVTHVLGLPLIWLWLCVLSDFFARAMLKSWRFRSGAWARVRV